MKKALVTLTIGEAYQEMGRITHPLMADYAHRCGVDFIVLSEPKVKAHYALNERYEKFQVFDLLDDYDQIAFVDTDILISPQAPSLFDLVPRDHFAAANEANYSQARRDRLLTQQVLGKVHWRNPYFNSGVMVFGRQHRAVFDPTVSELHLWSTGEFRKEAVNLLNDQPYLNHRLHKLDIPLLDLGTAFNHTRCITATHTRFRSHFIHYSGPSGHRYGSRIEQLRKDAEVMGSPTRLWLSRNVLSYRWCADRTDKAFGQYLAEKCLDRIEARPARSTCKPARAVSRAGTTTPQGWPAQRAATRPIWRGGSAAVLASAEEMTSRPQGTSSVDRSQGRTQPEAG